MRHKYVMNDHCPEYEHLTIEEKLLVDKEIREWFKKSKLNDLCVPVFIFRAAERRIIEILKGKDRSIEMNKAKKIEKLRNEIYLLENKMEVCAYGKEELLELTSMQEELAKLEGE